MNTKDSVKTALQRYALKRGVKKLSLEKQVFFKKLYGTHYENNAPKRPLTEALEIEISQIIDEISTHQLRTAVMQLANTIEKEENRKNY